MKQQTLLTGLALIAASVTPLPTRAQSVDPCTVYMCMAGISGFAGPVGGGPACAPTLIYWSAPSPAGLAVYHPPQGFNPPASAGLRTTYLNSCLTITVNPAVVSAIIAQHGWKP